MYEDFERSRSLKFRKRLAFLTKPEYVTHFKNTRGTKRKIALAWWKADVSNAKIRRAKNTRGKLQIAVELAPVLEGTEEMTRKKGTKKLAKHASDASSADLNADIMGGSIEKFSGSGVGEGSFDDSCCVAGAAAMGELGDDVDGDVARAKINNQKIDIWKPDVEWDECLPVEDILKLTCGCILTKLPSKDNQLTHNHHITIS